MYDYLPFVTATPDVTQATVVSAFPNPFDDRITIRISSENKGPVKITILGEDGRHDHHAFFRIRWQGMRKTLPGKEMMRMA